MKSIFKLSSWLTLVLCLITASAFAQKTLTIATNAEYPPFEYKSGDEFIGFDIDLAKQIAKDLDMELKINNISFPSVIPSVQAGRADVGISTITPTEKRKKYVDFSETYYTTHNTLIFKKNTNIKTLDDLKGKRLISGMGTEQQVVADILAKRYKTAAKVLDNSVLAFNDMMLDRADALVIENIQTSVFSEKCNNQCNIIDIDSSVLPATVGSGSAVAFPKNSPLFEKINNLIIKYKQNGFLQQLEDKWIK